MLRRTFHSFLSKLAKTGMLVGILAGNTIQTGTAQETNGSVARKGRVEANGLSYYYEIYGIGEPILLLHGGLGQIEMFGPNLQALARTREVIGVDLQGHG